MRAKCDSFESVYVNVVCMHGVCMYEAPIVAGSN